MVLGVYDIDGPQCKHAMKTEWHYETAERGLLSKWDIGIDASLYSEF